MNEFDYNIFQNLKMQRNDLYIYHKKCMNKHDTVSILRKAMIRKKCKSEGSQFISGTREFTDKEKHDKSMKKKSNFHTQLSNESKNPLKII